RPWTPADSLIIGKLLAESLSSTWTADLVNEAFSDLPKSTRQELRPQVSPWDVLAAGSDRVRRDDARRPSARGYWRDQAISTGFLDSLSSIDEAARRSLERAGLYAVERAASNNWVVSGEHSVSGKAMLANDPHLEPSAPSIWYMSHLTAPAFHVAGVTLPGVPCILLGHNDRIAWGATNLGSDVQDVYIVTFDKQNPRLYKTSRSWREASVRREYIKARKSLTDTATETIPFDVTVTRLGPIALERDSKRYAVRWTALDTHAFDVSAFYEINRAQNWKGFCAALSAYSGPAQNFVYADKEGHIGYYGAGKIPVRRSGDGTLPYDGSTDAGEWVGFIPFDKLPHSYDPPSGIIITANNRVVGRNYPYILTQSWAPPYRVRRILDLLQSKPRLSVDDFRAVQRDIYSISAAHFARNVVEIARKFDPAANDAKWNETVALLEQWDGRLGADSRAAPLLSYMRAAFRTRVAGRVLGDDRAKKYGSWVGSVFLDRIIADRPKEWLPAGFNNYLELLKVCEKEAREELAKRLGSDESKWVWGRLAEVRFAHPLAAAPLLGQRFVIQAFPQNGSTGAFPTVNAGSNVSMRFIADVSDWDKTEMGIALGESGDPASPHWDDQFADWRAAKARVFTFTKRGVAGATRETVILAAGN
ncbi:MAG TPA: penicillin acylase family protein, partial [Blastocatellia bacterium]